jgi:hypothetical protein
MQAMELFECRKNERKVLRSRLQSKGGRNMGEDSSWGLTTSQMANGLDLRGDGGDWQQGLWPIVLRYGMCRGFVGQRTLRSTCDVAGVVCRFDGALLHHGTCSQEEEAAIVQSILSHWPPDRCSIIKHRQTYFRAPAAIIFPTCNAPSLKSVAPLLMHMD